MGIGDILSGLKDKILDAATYELLRRNFELLEENNEQLKDRVAFLKEEAEKLKAQNLSLVERNAGLQARVDLASQAEEFIEFRGLAFKKSANGTVLPVAYCPECQARMTTVDHHIYICRSCRYTINAGHRAEALADHFNKENRAQQPPV